MRALVGLGLVEASLVSFSCLAVLFDWLDGQTGLHCHHPPIRKDTRDASTNTNPTKALIGAPAHQGISPIAKTVISISISISIFIKF